MEHDPRLCDYSDMVRPAAAQQDQVERLRFGYFVALAGQRRVKHRQLGILGRRQTVGVVRQGNPAVDQNVAHRMKASERRPVWTPDVPARFYFEFHGAK